MRRIMGGRLPAIQLGRAAALAVALLLALSGCVSSHAQSSRGTTRPTARPPSATAAQRPPVVQQGITGTLPEVVFTTANGQQVSLAVEIADTEPLRETGLMNRPSLPDDQGMAFVWENDVTEAFWMKDTLIPLSIAFIEANGVIVDTQEMQAETLDPHIPAAPYRVAIEANAGWYSRNGLQVGDVADLSQVFAASSLDNPQLTPSPAADP
ncbi:MAG TPA: DUF192 domain-containing protein [Dehalococcoidia bacterium]|nr:DUF192 domain-containing protein [Dehalococcoidia bacterium]